MNRGNTIVATLLACALIGTTSLYVFSQDLFQNSRREKKTRASNPLQESNYGSGLPGFFENAQPGMKTEHLQSHLNNEVLSLELNVRQDYAALERAALKLTQEYARATDSSRRAELTTELNETVEKQFAARQEARAKELDELEQQLKRLRDIHSRREREKQRIVDDRVRQLLRDADGLGWGSSTPRTIRGNTSQFLPQDGSDKLDLFAPPPRNRAR